MSVFEQRYKEHQRLYHHPKTSRFNYMMCDIFLLAEPYFRIRAADDDHCASPKLPISRCMMNAETYLLLTDGVIDKIENTDDAELRPRSCPNGVGGHRGVDQVKDLGRLRLVGNQRVRLPLL